MRADEFTIGTLARQAGVNVETIRYYQKRGLIAEPDRPLGGIRRYASEHVRRLRFIKQAQSLGFTLEEVTDLLALEDGRHCREAEQLGARKLAMVRDRMAQLRRVEKVLATLVDQCHCNTGKVRCPLIGALENDRRPTTRAHKKLIV
jgi:MerR family transcriptional regulator, mercuric resistance operon regulatory protein